MAVLAAILLIEGLVFSRAYYLSDRSTVCIVHKDREIRSRINPDIAVFGASRALCLDAAMLERTLRENLVVHNYALPHLGTTLQFHLTL